VGMSGVGLGRVSAADNEDGYACTRSWSSETLFLHTQYAVHLEIPKMNRKTTVIPGQRVRRNHVHRSIAEMTGLVCFSPLQPAILLTDMHI